MKIYPEATSKFWASFGWAHPAQLTRLLFPKTVSTPQDFF